MRLFRIGRNQAARIAREFELPGHHAIVRKKGERLIIEPEPPKSLLEAPAELTPIIEQFPDYFGTQNRRD